MTQNSSIAFVDTESGTQLVTRLNNVGETLRTTSRGTARPAYAAAGTLWVDSDTPGSGVETLHFFDGTDDLTVALLDVTNNRVKHTDLLIGASLPAAPDGKLHVHTASAGAVSALSSANDIVIEDSGDAGLSILVGSNSSARIVAGHSGDNDVGYIQYGIAEKRWQIGADAGEWYYFNDNGLFGIRETVNTFMTTGLTVNQDTADDEILAFKSSDVAHASTDYAEADTWGYFQKITGARGGIMMMGIADSFGGGIKVMGIAPTPDTADISSSQSIIEMDAAKSSGTGRGAAAATENIFGVKNNDTNRVLFKGDGTVHASDTSWATSIDTEDDVQLGRAFSRQIARKGYIQSRWDHIIDNEAEMLRAAGILGSINPATGRSDMVAIQPTIMLALGQGWQNYERIMEDRERADDLEMVIAGVMPEIAPALNERRAGRQLERS